MNSKQDYAILDSLKEYLSDYLNQVFAIDSIVKVSKAIVANEKEIRSSMEAVDSFVTADAWIKSAQEAIERFEPLYQKADSIEQSLSGENS